MATPLRHTVSGEQPESADVFKRIRTELRLGFAEMLQQETPQTGVDYEVDSTCNTPTSSDGLTDWVSPRQDGQFRANNEGTQELRRRKAAMVEIHRTSQELETDNERLERELSSAKRRIEELTSSQLQELSQAEQERNYDLQTTVLQLHGALAAKEDELRARAAQIKAAEDKVSRAVEAKEAEAARSQELVAQLSDRERRCAELAKVVGSMTDSTRDRLGQIDDKVVELRGQLSRARAENQLLLERLEDADGDKQAQRGRIGELEALLEMRVAEVRKLVGERGQLEARCMGVEDDLARQQQQARQTQMALHERIGELEGMLVSLQQDHTAVLANEAQAKLQVQLEVARLQAELSERAKQLEDAEHRVDELTWSWKESQSGHETSQSQLRQQDTVITGLTASLASASADSERLLSVLKSAEEQLLHANAQLEEQRAAFGMERSAAALQVNCYAEEVQRVRGEAETKEAAIRGLEEKAQALVHEVQKARAELSTMTEEYHGLESQLRAKHGEIQGLNMLVARLKDELERERQGRAALTEMATAAARLHELEAELSRANEQRDALTSKLLETTSAYERRLMGMQAEQDRAGARVMEVEGEVEGLKAEAERVSARHREELDGKDRVILALDAQRQALHSEQEDVKRELQVKSLEVQQLVAKVGSKDAEIVALRASLSEAGDKQATDVLLPMLEKKAEGLREQLRKTREELMNKSQTCEELAMQLETKQVELSSMERSFTRLKDAFERERESRTTIAAELQSTAAKVQSLQLDLDRAIEHDRVLSDQLGEAVRSYEDKLSDVQAQLDMAKTEVTALQGEVSSTRATAEAAAVKAREALGAKDKAIVELDLQRQAVVKELREAEAEIQASKGVIQDLSAKLDSRDVEVTALQASLSEAQASVKTAAVVAEDLRKARSELAYKAEAYEELLLQLEAKQAELGSLERSLARLKDALDREKQNRDALADMQSRVRELETELARASEDKQQLLSTVAEVRADSERHISGLQAEVERRNAQVVVLQEQLLSAKVTAEEMEARTREGLDAKDKVIVTLDSQRQALAQRVEKMQEELDAKETTLREMTARVASQQADFLGMQASMAELQEAKAMAVAALERKAQGLTEDVRSSRTELLAKTEECEVLSLQLDERHVEVDRLERSVTRLKDALARERQSHAAAGEDKSIANARVQDLEMELSETQEQRNLLRAELAQAERQISHVRAQLERAQGRVLELQEELTSVNRELSGREEELVRSREEALSATLQVQALVRRTNELEAKNQAKDQELSAASRALETKTAEVGALHTNLSKLCEDSSASQRRLQDQVQQLADELTRHTEARERDTQRHELVLGGLRNELTQLQRNHSVLKAQEQALESAVCEREERIRQLTDELTQSQMGGMSPQLPTSEYIAALDELSHKSTHLQREHIVLEAQKQALESVVVQRDERIKQLSLELARQTDSHEGGAQEQVEQESAAVAELRAELSDVQQHHAMLAVQKQALESVVIQRDETIEHLTRELTHQRELVVDDHAQERLSREAANVAELRAEMARLQRQLVVLTAEKQALESVVAQRDERLQHLSEDTEVNLRAGGTHSTEQGVVGDHQGDSRVAVLCGEVELLRQSVAGSSAEIAKRDEAIRELQRALGDAESKLRQAEAQVKAQASDVQESRRPIGAPVTPTQPSQLRSPTSVRTNAKTAKGRVSVGGMDPRSASAHIARREEVVKNAQQALSSVPSHRLVGKGTSKVRRVEPSVEPANQSEAAAGQTDIAEQPELFAHFDALTEFFWRTLDGVSFGATGRQLDRDEVQQRVLDFKRRLAQEEEHVTRVTTALQGLLDVVVAADSEILVGPAGFSAAHEDAMRAGRTAGRRDVMLRMFVCLGVVAVVLWRQLVRGALVVFRDLPRWLGQPVEVVM